MGGGWVEAGVRRIRNWAQIPGTACHAPGFIHGRFKEPWNLSRATQTNYSNKHAHTHAHTHSQREQTRLPGGKLTGQDPITLATEPQQARPAADCMFQTLFVCLLKNTRDTSSREGYLHRAQAERNWKKTTNYVLFCGAVVFDWQR